MSTFIVYFVIKVFEEDLKKKKKFNLTQKHFIGKEKKRPVCNALNFLNCHGLKSRLAKT